MALAQRVARSILYGFEANFAEFQTITLGAKERFEKADWHAVHTAMADRMQRYKDRLYDVAEVIASIAGEKAHQRELWREVKKEYDSLIWQRANYEIAETFYNSVFGRICGHANIREAHTYLLESNQRSRGVDQAEITCSFCFEGSLRQLIRQVLSVCEFTIPFEDFERDVERIAEVAKDELLDRLPADGRGVRVEVLESLFYRNKAAYLVGRIVSGVEFIPFVVPILNNGRGAVYVDTAIFTSEEVSVIFSFTRSYFMVDAAVPSRYVAFLKSLMPQKEPFELYTSMGYYKHGKTEFCRMAIKHTRNSKSNEQYIVAPGIKGMVMLVFTLPSLGYVYKVIKDRFSPPKTVTREQVKQKYQQVKRGDRVGRMADTQEFTDLVFDRRRFSPELLAELRREAPSLLKEKGNALVLKHVYVERKMIPLNIYLQQASDSEVENAMEEYGNAIKQLAAANIFPGDMLLKNFGVTRHGRVVFYDYDEICTMAECNFREIPKPRTLEQEMASEPWYEVGENDIFPEEFQLFFSGNRRAREAFDQRHRDIYEVKYWRGLQEQIEQGVVHDVFPYRRKIRFERQKGPSDGYPLVTSA